MFNLKKLLLLNLNFDYYALLKAIYHKLNNYLDIQKGFLLYMLYWENILKSLFIN